MNALFWYTNISATATMTPPFKSYEESAFSIHTR